MKKIAVIDPFIVSPALPCFNRLVESLDAKLQYHQPQLQGITTLKKAPADAYIVLGSASHVFQNLPWHQPLADFLFNVLHEKRPVLGLCFGHQLMCQRFGGVVDYYAPDETKLTGPREVKITQDVFGLKSGTVLKMAVSHRQVVKVLPPELEEIGVGLRFDLIRHKTLPFLGSQPHAEASVDFCSTEALMDNSADVESVQTDGMKLVRSFFHHHGILARI
ncbi:MAG: glutamine amidotransferase-related protein [Bacteriovoracia bacterium]